MKKIVYIFILWSGCCLAEDFAPYWRSDLSEEIYQPHIKHMVVTMEAYDKSKSDLDREILRVNLLVEVDCYIEICKDEADRWTKFIGDLDDDRPDYFKINVQKAIDKGQQRIAKLIELKEKLKQCVSENYPE